MNAYERAVKLLSQREHTAKEIERKLLDKGHSREEIEETISKLLSLGYISEERFAESYIRSRLRKCAEGRGLLRLRLKEKGTPSSIADEYLSKAWEEKLYVEVLKKEYRSLLNKYGQEKAVMKLQSKGFAYSEIKEVASDNFDF